MEEPKVHGADSVPATATGSPQGDDLDESSKPQAYAQVLTL